MKKKFHENLTRIRKAKNYTQAQIADRLEISRSTYANYEAGKRSPDLEMLDKISQVLDVSLDELFGRYPKNMPGVICESEVPYGVNHTPASDQAAAAEPVSEVNTKRGRKKGLAIGVQDFRKIRQSGSYYTDKTRMIAEFLDNETAVTLITRPRRFGKTLNMSMLAEFLDCTKDSREIFEGTEITDSRFAEEMNRHPVVFFTFHNVKGNTKGFLLRNLFQALAVEYERYGNIWRDERVSESVRSELEDVYTALRTANEIERDMQEKIAYAIQLLSQALYEYYGEEVYILIDEYDTPFIEAHVNGYYSEIHDTLAILLSSALKGNPALKKAMLTGIQRVAKENIFSGLNNLLICTVKDPEYSDCFGFTEEETKSLLNYYGLDLTEEVKAMYDGYLFDTTEVYNPWSVINYASRKRLEPYWVNTSENKMIRDAMDQCGEGFRKEYEELISQGRVTSFVQIETSFYEYQSSESLWGLLINAGMVTVEEIVDMDLYTLRIPNQEVGRAFRGLTAHHLHVSEGDLGRLFLSLRQKRMDSFAEQYCRMVLEFPSYHDLKDENSYHMLMLGMCAYLSGDCEVKSNRESGKGRSDIILKSKNGKYPNVIMEFKYTKDEKEDLHHLAKEAVRQVKEKKYDSGIKGKVWYMGLAHCGKEAEVVWELAV